MDEQTSRAERAHNDAVDMCADFLEVSAADLDARAVTLREQRAALGPKAYALQSSRVQTFLRLAREAEGQARLLRAHAQCIRATKVTVHG